MTYWQRIELDLEKQLPFLYLHWRSSEKKDSLEIKEDNDPCYWFWFQQGNLQYKLQMNLKNSESMKVSLESNPYMDRQIYL